MTGKSKTLIVRERHPNKSDGGDQVWIILADENSTTTVRSLVSTEEAETAYPLGQTFTMQLETAQA